MKKSITVGPNLYGLVKVIFLALAVGEFATGLFPRINSNFDTTDFTRNIPFIGHMILCLAYLGVGFYADSIREDME